MMTGKTMNTINAFGQPMGDALEDWQPRPHPERVVLTGRYCRLEPLCVGHAQALFSAYQLAEDTRSWTWLLREPDATADAFAGWVESVSELSDPMHFTVIDNQTQSPVGTLALNKGWELAGSPSYAFNATAGIMHCGQAVTKTVEGKEYDPEMKLGEQ